MNNNFTQYIAYSLFGTLMLFAWKYNTLIGIILFFFGVLYLYSRAMSEGKKNRELYSSINPKIVNQANIFLIALVIILIVSILTRFVFKNEFIGSASSVLLVVMLIFAGKHFSKYIKNK